jgi:hypothetical protein
MSNKFFALLTMAFVMNQASANINDESSNVDKLVKSDTVTKQFVTSVTVESQVTKINEGTEIYKRPNGTCYQVSRKVDAVRPDQTNILGITLELPEVSTREKDVDC